MKTLKYFNSVTPDKQCEFVIDLLDSFAVDNGDLASFIQDGVSQGESKDNIVKLLLLLRGINKGQKEILEDLKPLWIQTLRQDKLNQLL